MNKFVTMRRIIFPALIVFLAGFAIYLSILYKQLDRAFAKQDQFVPTRIYSDVSRIAQLIPKSTLLEKLKALNYTYKSHENDLTFTLHSIDYPEYLIPPSHPTFELMGKPVTLHFDSPTAQAVLQSIEGDGKPILDLYLEPELAATLSRGNSTDASGHQIRENLKFEDVPANIWKAIIAIEDQHFMEHKGLDPRGLARAVWVDLRSRSLAQGGSTLTLQLVKNLMARRTKNIFRKVNELFLAVLLEMKFNKEQILERYLNEVYLGQVGSLEIHGVAEGAEHFFGKKLDDLNLAETALMAGLIRGPGFYSPYRYPERAFERQKLVLRKMVETGEIAEAEAQAAFKMPVHLTPPQSVANRAPYFVDFVKAELIENLKDRYTEQEIPEAGLRVYSTIDMNLNTLAQHAVTTGVEDLQKRFKLSEVERLEGALASVDQNTGFIRALVGGTNYSRSGFNRILNMKRQVGSTFKPFVYLTALSRGYDPQGVVYAPSHPAEDAPWTLKWDSGRQNWTPHDYEKDYLGWISYRTALAHSINTIAAKLGNEIGIPSVAQTAKTLGIKSDLPLVPSLALGVAELSPLELLRAYGTFANHGTETEFTVIRGITLADGKLFKHFVSRSSSVYDSAAVDLLTDMLQSVFTQGTALSAAQLGFKRPAAGKTGTTSNHRDSWFAGYAPQVTTVVWVGMDQDNVKTKLNLTGAIAALPIWTHYMKEALASEPPIAFPDNSGIGSYRIDVKSGKEALPGCPPSQVLVEKFLKQFPPRSNSCEALWPASVPETTQK